MSVVERSYWNAEIETQPARERAAMQLDKLRRQLAYVVDRSPFYARKFASAGFDASRLHSLDDLRLAPFTTKEELRESQIASPPLGNHAAAELRDVIRIHSSSGTTGRPSYVGITRRDRDVWTETVSRVYWCEGVRPEDVVVHGFGLGFFVGGLPLKDAIENIGATFIPIGTGACGPARDEHSRPRRHRSDLYAVVRRVPGRVRPQPPPAGAVGARPAADPARRGARRRDPRRARSAGRRSSAPS